MTTDDLHAIIAARDTEIARLTGERDLERVNHRTMGQAWMTERARVVERDAEIARLKRALAAGPDLARRWSYLDVASAIEVAQRRAMEEE